MTSVVFIVGVHDVTNSEVLVDDDASLYKEIRVRVCIMFSPESSPLAMRGHVTRSGCYSFVVVLDRWFAVAFLRRAL